MLFLQAADSSAIPQTEPVRFDVRICSWVHFFDPYKAIRILSRSLELFHVLLRVLAFFAVLGEIWGVP